MGQRIDPRTGLAPLTGDHPAGQWRVEAGAGCKEPHRDRALGSQLGRPRHRGGPSPVDRVDPQESGRHGGEIQGRITLTTGFSKWHRM